MSRHELQHTVLRSQRSPNTYIVERDDEVSILLLADVAAAFTMANDWRQEIVNLDTGVRSSRRRGSAWTSHDAEGPDVVA